MKNQTETTPSDSTDQNKTEENNVSTTKSGEVATPAPIETKTEEPQAADVTTTKTLETESPAIRPPSRYGMDLRESEKIDRSIKQAMWKTYKKSSDDHESAEDYSNWSDQSDVSSVEQVKDKDTTRNSNSSQKSQTSQTSQASKTSQVSQGSQASPASDVKPPQSVSTEDQKRVFVKVNTEGIGSSRYTSYEIEVLVRTRIRYNITL